MDKLNIWIDVASAPQVQLYRPIMKEFERQGHKVFFTARDFLETVALAKLYQLPFTVIGQHGGETLIGKTLAIARRTWLLIQFIRHHQIHIALGHNSHAQSLAAGFMLLPLVIMTDYEHQPAHYLSLRFAKRVLVPQSVLVTDLQRFGIPLKRVERYDGIKEDIYLSDFEPDADFRQSWNISEDKIFVVMRPPATMSAYHQFENPLFDTLLSWLSKQEKVYIMVFPRTHEQATAITALGLENIFIPPSVIDGRQAIYAADLVIGAGGTMTREATVLGTPSYSLFAGSMGGVDKWLIEQKRLVHLRSEADIPQIKLQKKNPGNLQTFGKPHLIQEIVETILSAGR